MVLGMGIDAVVLSKEFEAWDVFQYWSIPKIGLEFDNGRPAEFIAEKSNGFDESNEVDMLLSQAYKFEGDVDFQKSVNGESGLTGCDSETPLCGTAV
jgi:hypothetical protein